MQNIKSGCLVSVNTGTFLIAEVGFVAKQDRVTTKPALRLGNRSSAELYSASWIIVCFDVSLAPFFFNYRVSFKTAKQTESVLFQLVCSASH